jgi:hypothetical protein
MQDPPKFTQIGIFGLKICHLATLSPSTERNVGLFLPKGTLVMKREFQAV